MARKIDFDTYIKNYRLKNKKKISRSLKGIFEHPEELNVMRLPGVIDRLPLEVTINSSVVSDFIELLRGFGFRTMGSDYYYLECKYNDYMTKKYNAGIKPNELEKMELELLDLKSREAMFSIDNDDAKFTLIPYKERIATLADFIREYKDKIVEFSRKHDVTIIMNPKGYSDQINGFIGFNFYDLDEAEAGNKEVEVEYASSINVAVDFNKEITIYSSAMYLSAIGKDSKDLKYMNVNLFADNYR